MLAPTNKSEGGEEEVVYDDRQQRQVPRVGPYLFVSLGQRSPFGNGQGADRYFTMIDGPLFAENCGALISEIYCNRFLVRV